jgi:protoheme IX farnesyltransferase
MSCKKYLTLSKPGIIFGNLITLVGGFLLATHRQIGIDHLSILVFTMAGVALMIASGCVFNNCYDRDIDSAMERTKKRPLVTHDISLRNALLFGTVMFFVSCFILYTFVNALTLYIILVGFFVYVVVYTLSKRVTIYSTVLGSISGAIPPVAGYVAVTNSLDYNALALFLVLFFWQIPHSYAIAILYMKDYKKANLPLLPIVKGVAHTKKTMLGYLVLFVASCTLPYLIGSADVVSLIVTMFIALLWAYKSFKSYLRDDDAVFAKTVFKLSIIVVTVICITLG